MDSAKVAQRAVGGKLSGRQDPERHILVQLARDLRELNTPVAYAYSSTFDHHGRMKRLVARSATGIPGGTRSDPTRRPRR